MVQKQRHKYFWTPSVPKQAEALHILNNSALLNRLPPPRQNGRQDGRRASTAGRSRVWGRGSGRLSAEGGRKAGSRRQPEPQPKPRSLGNLRNAKWYSASSRTKLTSPHHVRIWTSAGSEETGKERNSTLAKSCETLSRSCLGRCRPALSDPGKGARPGPELGDTCGRKSRSGRRIRPSVQAPGPEEPDARVTDSSQRPVGEWRQDGRMDVTPVIQWVSAAARSQVSQAGTGREERGEEVGKEVSP